MIDSNGASIDAGPARIIDLVWAEIIGVNFP